VSASAEYSEQRRVATVALVVAYYDEAISWYTKKLGFLLVDDTALGGGKRWVVVAPPSQGGARLLLAEASNDEQRTRIGNQTGGRVFLFLETDDFSRDHQAMQDRGGIPRRSAQRGLRHRGGVCRSPRQSLGSDRAAELNARGHFSRLANRGCVLRNAGLYRRSLPRPSSSGQDGALSRRKQGFDSPWAYQKIPS
jgi:catechol 2,3-dioxygenase-like lactoylglutathione lyase family enzyme